MEKLQRGVYRHYKGGLYCPLHIVKIVAEKPARALEIMSANLSEDREWEACVFVDLDTGELVACLFDGIKPLMAIHHETYPVNSFAIVYASLTKARAWLRPLKMWNELVEWNPNLFAKRFVYAGRTVAEANCHGPYASQDALERPTEPDPSPAPPEPVQGQEDPSPGQEGTPP